jgi:hypothetical protein
MLFTASIANSWPPDISLTEDEAGALEAAVKSVLPETVNSISRCIGKSHASLPLPLSLVVRRHVRDTGTPNRRSRS